MTEKKTLQVSEILADFNQGLSDEELRSKYGLTQDELGHALDQMIANQQLEQSELQAHRALEAGLLEIPGHLSAKYRKKEVWGIVVGILGCIVGTLFLAIHIRFDTVFVLCCLAGTVAFIWGCCYLAKSKGYHGAFGLLGVLGCIGLLILVLIPDRLKGAGSRASMALIIVVSVFAIVNMMVVIGYFIVIYQLYPTNTRADRAANGDVSKLVSAMQRLANETVHANGDWETLCKKIDDTNIKWLLGTYYGFYGTNQEAGVRIFIDTDKNEIRGFALKGLRPMGQQSRYVFRASICEGKDLPAERSMEDFSKYYPITGTCYTTSMITGSGGQVTFTKPTGSVPCSDLLSKD